MGDVEMTVYRCEGCGGKYSVESKMQWRCPYCGAGGRN